MLGLSCNKTRLDEVIYVLKFKFKELRLSQGLLQDELSKKSNVDFNILRNLCKVLIDYSYVVLIPISNA